MSVTKLSCPGKSLTQRFLVMHVLHPTETGMSKKWNLNPVWGGGGGGRPPWRAPPPPGDPPPPWA